MFQVKPEQKSCIDAILCNRNVVVNLPTGFGKTFIVEQLADQYEKSIVLIEPMVSIINEKEATLKSSTILCGLLDNAARETSINSFLSNQTKILITTPESYQNYKYQLQGKDYILAMDEAHCILDFGNFRPSYKKIFEENQKPYVLLSGSLDKESLEYFHSYDPNVIVISAPSEKQNVKEYLIQDYDFRSIHRLISPQAKTLIFTQTISTQDRLSFVLSRYGVYHTCTNGKIDKEERTKIETAFRKEKSRVLIATSCFSMGVNVVDIDRVIIFGIPMSIKDYIQKAGRAGRDGRPADVITILSDIDLRFLRACWMAQGQDPAESHYQTITHLNNHTLRL